MRDPQLHRPRGEDIHSWCRGALPTSPSHSLSLAVRDAQLHRPRGAHVHVLPYSYIHMGRRCAGRPCPALFVSLIRLRRPVHSQLRRPTTSPPRCTRPCPALFVHSHGQTLCGTSMSCLIRQPHSSATPRTFTVATPNYIAPEVPGGPADGQSI